MAIPKTSASNRIVLLTVGMVVVAGMLSALGAFIQVRRASDSYDEAIKTELQQKGYGIASTATFFLDSLGPSALTSLEGFATEGFAQSEDVAGGRTDLQGNFSNVFLKLEVWSPTETGFALAFEQALSDTTLGGPSRGSPQIITSVAQSDTPTSTIDEDARALDMYVPFSFDASTRLVLVGTLDASEEFEFFAAQRDKVMRNGILLSIAITGFVSLVGAGLSVLVSRTLTTRKRVEEELREGELRYRTLASIAPVGIFRNDTEGNNVYSNQRTLDILGVTAGAPEGSSWSNYLHPEDRDRTLKEWREAMASKTDFHSQYRFLRPDGSVVWVLGHVTPERNVHGAIVGYVGTITDITDQKRLEEALREQTRRDPLTGTLNHSALVEELRQRISKGPEGPPFAVAMVDVDGMKATNDTYGHQVGDAVLKTVAEALSRDDATVARYGGDEFVAILQNGDRAGAERYRTLVAKQLQKHEVTEPDTGLRVPLSVSMGLAVYPGEAQGVMELIKLSDDAMYASRLQRPVVPNLKGMPRRRDERAARMVSEVMPLLTSDASLADKMRLVAHQLSVGAGYEVVGFDLVGSGSPVTATYAFGSLNPTALKEWNDHSEKPTGRSLHPILERTHRPVIVNDLMTDPRVSDGDREMAAAGGVHSALAAPMLWHDEFVGVLSVASKRPNAFGSRDAQFVSSVATQVTAIIRMARLLDDLRAATAHLTDAQDETVMLLAAAAEEHEAGLSGHFQGVRSLAEALAGEIGYDEEEARQLGLAAALHDVGKIRVQHETLSHNGPLSPEQWTVLRQHTLWGESFFKGHPAFSLAAVIARSHHEHWDGGGYPDGLVGDQIPEIAAITSVADAFDAIVNGRPYRAARTIDEAVQEVVVGSGKQFSPRIVDALVRLHARGALPLARDAIEEIAA